MVSEGASTIRKDIQDVKEHLLKVHEEGKRKNLYRKLLWAGTLAALLIAATLAALSLFAIGTGHQGRPTSRDVAFGALSLASGVLVALGLGYRLVRSKLAQYELERRTAEYRESIRVLTSMMSSSEDLAVLKRYREDIAVVIEDYRTTAGHYRRVHNWFQSFVIIGSIVTTSVTSAAGQITAFRVVAPIISIIVGIAAGMTGYFKFRERSLNLQQTADDIEHEYNAVELRIEGYRRAPDEREALIDFAEKVERLKDEQRKREQQLEQPPESSQHQGY